MKSFLSLLYNYVKVHNIATYIAKECSDFLCKQIPVAIMYMYVYMLV